jgi:hypothetical protein
MALGSLAVMAHLAAGVTPDDAEHGPWLERTVRYVLACQDENGYFGNADGSRMYGHGIALLMLAEALGMCKDDELEERLRVAIERGVALTVNAARIAKRPPHDGGWRYQPGDNSSDMSLTGWQLMGLHAAQQVGVPVPEQVVANAVTYSRRMIGGDGKVGYEQPNQDRPALRGLALLALGIGHQLEAPEVAKVAGRIEADPIKWEGEWFFYRAYYDAVGLNRAAPQRWATYGKRLEQVLVEHQNPDGSWPFPPNNNEGGNGPIYATTLAVLALTVDRHVLPAYQR